MNGSAVLDMRRMDRILQIDEEKRTVTVQAGVLMRRLVTYLERRGFFVADQPESWFAATVGARTQANGIGYLYNSRYGHSVSQVLCLEVVLPTGEIIRTGAPGIYDPASGYDLTRLFSCAEGTLAIVTEVTFRIYKLPEYRVMNIIEYPVYDDMVSAVMAIRDSGLVPETIEMLDVAGYRTYTQGSIVGPHPVTSTLASLNMGAMIIGYAGVARLTEAQMDLTEELCNRWGGVRGPESSMRAWRAFKETYPVNPYPVCTALMKKPMKYVLDATVHLESVAAVVRAYRELVSKYRIESHGIVAVPCAPDFHAVVYAQAYVDERDKREVETIRRLQGDIHGYVARIGGSIGGAGGVGLKLGKIKGGPTAEVKVMGRLKDALDPHNIMNPGKKL